MNSINRRNFVQLAGAACLSTAVQPGLAASSSKETRTPPGSSPIRLGLVVWIRDGQTVDDAVKRVHDLGLATCQIGFETLRPDAAGSIKQALEKYGIEATAFSEHGPGERIFTVYQGPETIGIVPPATRRARIHNLEVAADIASKCGIPAVHTHCGFIPENPNDPLYPQAVAAVKEIGIYCKERGVIFLCETGQETPITLLRLIEDTGMDNVFVNLDVANLILYGNGNPVDAMDVFGAWVRGIHAKDGFFPTDPKKFGKEVAIGKGKVDFPTVMKQLKAVNYKGSMTIEREIDGPQQTKDILASKTFLNNLLAKTYS